MSRCAICGAEHAACGHTAAAEPVPVDKPIKREDPVGGQDLVRVEVRPGVWLKLTPKEAERHRAEQARSRDDADEKRRSAFNKKRRAKNKTEDTPVRIQPIDDEGRGE